MFSFFRETVGIDTTSGGIVKEDQDNSIFGSFLMSDPIASVIVKNLASPYVENDKFFSASLTCPEYMLPFIFSLTASYGEESQRYTILNENGRLLNQRIFDFSISEIEKSRYFKTSDLFKMRDDFISLLPATIRPSLKNYIINLFFYPDSIAGSRFVLTFDQFFQRMAIFTVLNEFQAFKSQKGEEPTLSDFISSEGMRDTLHERFHKGKHTVHDETINLIHAIFKLPAKQYSTADADTRMWEYFILGVCSELSYKNSMYNFTNDTIHTDYVVAAKTVEAFRMTKKSDISFFVNNIQGGKMMNNNSYNYTNVSLIYELADMKKHKDNYNNLTNSVYCNIIKSFQLHDLENIKNFNDNHAFSIIKTTKKSHYNRNRHTILHNENVQESLEKDIFVFNSLMMVSQKMNIIEPDPFFENIEDEEKYNKFVQLVDIVVDNSYNDNNVSQESIDNFCQMFIDNNEFMPIEILLNLSGLNNTSVVSL